jgi:hypothetical protein
MCKRYTITPAVRLKRGILWIDRTRLSRALEACQPENLGYYVAEILVDVMRALADYQQLGAVVESGDPRLGSHGRRRGRR